MKRGTTQPLFKSRRRPARTANRSLYIDEQDNVIASYTWGDGIDNLLAVKTGGASYYALTDIQGTVWGYVDSQNNVVARWRYDAWGNVLDEEVSVPALASLRYRFQCREWSAATGLVNFRMRWYDAETGRWLSKDPIGLGGGLNLYAFCNSDTLQNVDFNGLCAKPDKIVQTGIAVTTIGGLMIAMSGQLPPMPPHITAVAVAGCWMAGGAFVLVGATIVVVGSL